MPEVLQKHPAIKSALNGADQQQCPSVVQNLKKEDVLLLIMHRNDKDCWREIRGYSRDGEETG